MKPFCVHASCEAILCPCITDMSQDGQKSFNREKGLLLQGMPETIEYGGPGFSDEESQQMDEDGK